MKNNYVRRSIKQEVKVGFMFFAEELEWYVKEHALITRFSKYEWKDRLGVIS